MTIAVRFARSTVRTPSASHNRKAGQGANMTKKAQIIIIILCSITVTSVIIAANLLTRNWLDSMRQDVYVTATNQMVGRILASIEQKGQVVITVPDGNEGTKSMVLIPAEGVARNTGQSHRKEAPHGTPTNE